MVSQPMVKIFFSVSLITRLTPFEQSCLLCPESLNSELLTMWVIEWMSEVSEQEETQSRVYRFSPGQTAEVPDKLRICKPLLKHCWGFRVNQPSPHWLHRVQDTKCAQERRSHLFLSKVAASSFKTGWWSFPIRETNQLIEAGLSGLQKRWHFQF